MTTTSPSSEVSQSSARQHWNDLFYSTLRDASRPVFVFNNTTVPAASLWTGARIWTKVFREAGLNDGDRVVVDLPSSPAFIQVLIAGFWDNLTLVITNPEKETRKRALDYFKARAGISTSERPHFWKAQSLSGPENEPSIIDRSHAKQTEEIRLFLSTSGTTGSPDWYGLSDQNLLSVLQSHQTILNQTDSALSYLPWHHCFGLVLGLLNHLLTNKIVYRDPTGGKDIQQIGQLIRDEEPEYLNSVPVLIESIHEEFGRSILSSFEEGIVGGAPLDGHQSDLLDGTSLRVGYGQTEASPGITLGHPGRFEPGYIGQPVGCQVKTSDQSELEFYGPNAYQAHVDEDATIREHSTPRWIGTGDLAEKQNNDWYFKGRIQNGFKLPNGTFCHPREFEQELRQHEENIKNIFIDTNDNHHPIAYVQLKNSNQTVDSVRSSIESVVPYLESIIEMTDDFIERNKKGEVNRGETRKFIDRILDIKNGSSQ